jgi:hypothetical protein
MEVTRLVITVAAQKLIWAQGSLYPKKEIIIKSKKRISPENQTGSKKKLENPTPRNTCKYIAKKIPDTPLACKKRNLSPVKVSRVK